jgi:hypothetical protein
MLRVLAPSGRDVADGMTTAVGAGPDGAFGTCG